MSIKGEDDEIGTTERKNSYHAVTAEIGTSECKDSHHAGTVRTCNFKCLHQGDRICFNDEPTKQTVKKIPEDSTNTDSTESDESIHSGESVFKTFNFEAQSEDPDMQKCMAFWSEILGKNIKPMKCTLLKNNQPKQKETVKEVPKINPCNDEETQKLWIGIYKDLQRRKLDKYKLVNKKKCDPCEYVDEEAEKKQDIRDIKNLNTWQSQSQPLKVDVKAQIHRTMQALKGKSPQSNNKTSEPKPSSTTTTNKTILSKSDVTNKSEPIKTMSTPPPTPNKTLDNQKRQEICSACGVVISECICTEQEEISMSHQVQVLRDQNQASKPEPCYPCDCTIDCTCSNAVAMQDEKMCSCGCRVEECMCGKFEHEKCPCECGMEECICEQLFTKSCKCGHLDCDCGMIEILNAYLESLEKPSKPCVSMLSENVIVSRQSQASEVPKPTRELATTQQPGSYCVICGHFNCYCKSEMQSQ